MPTNLQRPLPLQEMPVAPEITRPFIISDDLQQTLAMLFGYDGSGRRPIRCNNQGTLYVASPVVKDNTVITGSGADYQWCGDNENVSEVIIMADPGNGSNIYVKFDETATSANGWPLAAKDSLTITINNMARVNVLVVADGEKFHLLKTR